VATRVIADLTANFAAQLRQLQQHPEEGTAAAEDGAAGEEEQVPPAASFALIWVIWVIWVWLAWWWWCPCPWGPNCRLFPVAAVSSCETLFVPVLSGGSQGVAFLDIWPTASPRHSRPPAGHRPV
jgi:hypothetical protein